MSACRSGCIVPSPEQVQRDTSLADTDNDTLWLGCEKSSRKNTAVRACVASFSWETLAYLALNKKLVLDLTPCGECENDVCAAQLRKELTRLVEFLGPQLFESRVTLAYQQEDAPYHVQELSRREMFSHMTEGSRAGTKKLLQLLPGAPDEVIDTLESTFGELNDKETLAVAIESAARNAVEDNIPDYLSDLIYSVKDSFLDGVSEEEITHIFKKTVRNSVAYMTMTRLGIEAGEYFEPDDLRDVVNFTTPATLNALGYATSDIAEMGLAEIYRTILALDRQNRIIAEKTKADYNVGKEKTERSPAVSYTHLTLPTNSRV